MFSHSQPSKNYLCGEETVVARLPMNQLHVPGAQQDKTKPLPGIWDCNAVINAGTLASSSYNQISQEPKIICWYQNHRQYWLLLALWNKHWHLHKGSSFWRLALHQTELSGKPWHSVAAFPSDRRFAGFVDSWDRKGEHNEEERSG